MKKIFETKIQEIKGTKMNRHFALFLIATVFAFGMLSSSRSYAGDAPELAIGQGIVNVITEQATDIENEGGPVKAMVNAVKKLFGGAKANPAEDGKLNAIKNDSSTSREASDEENGDTAKTGNSGEQGPSAGSTKDKFEDKVAKVTNGAFKDKWVAAMNGELTPPIGRSTELDNVAVFARSPETKRGIVLFGPTGAGKSAIYDGFQREIIGGDVPGISSNSREIEFDFAQMKTPEEFADYLTKIKELITQRELPGMNKKTGEDPHIFLRGKNAELFGKPDRDQQAAMPPFDQYYGAAQKVFGKDATFLIEIPGAQDIDPETGKPKATTEALTAAFPFLKSKGWRFQFVGEMGLTQSKEALNEFINNLERKHGVTISDEVVNFADQICRKFYVDKVQPGCTAYLLEEAVGRKLRMLRKGRAPMLAEDLYKAKQKLVERLQHMKSLTGLYAREQVEKIPDQIKQIEGEIAKIEANTNRMAEASKKLKEAPKLQDDLKLLTAKLKAEPSQAAKLRGEIDSLKEKVASLKEIEKETRTLTKEDLAVQAHHDTKVSYLEIFKENKPKTFKEAWDEFQKEYDGAATYFELFQDWYYDTARPGRGQDAAMDVVALIGDPGTGKTFLFKKIAKVLFNNHIVEVNGGDYQDKYAATSFTGGSPNLVGYEEGSWIQNKIRQYRDGAVLLIDEFTRMHEDIVNNSLLHWFSDNGGALSDTKGRTASMRNILVGLTSNLGEGELTPETPQSEIRAYAEEHGMIPALLRRIRKFYVLRNKDVGGQAAFIKFKLNLLTDTGYGTDKDIGLSFENEADMAGYIEANLRREFKDTRINASDVENMINSQIRSKFERLLASQRYMTDEDQIVKERVVPGDKVEAYIDPANPEAGVQFRVLH